MLTGNDPGERANNRIGDVEPKILRRNADVKRRIENFEKMAHAQLGGFFAEGSVGFQHGEITFQMVAEGDRIEAKIGKAAHPMQAGCAEGACGFRAITSATGMPDVGRVVVTHSGGDGAGGKTAFIPENFCGRSAHQHDVDEAGACHVAHGLQIITARGEFPAEIAVLIAHQSGRHHPEGHVGILGVSDDEIIRAVFSGTDTGKFVVETFHDHCFLDMGGNEEGRRVGQGGFRLAPGKTSSAHAALQPTDGFTLSPSLLPSRIINCCCSVSAAICRAGRRGR